jgi:hypothetical protein
MSPPQDPRVTLRLQSDPAWIGLAIAGTLVASNALFVTLFQGSRLSPALGVLPGMTLAVFVGSALAHAARRRGGTLSLESNRFRMELRAADARHEVLDLGAPIAAVILCGAHDGRRMLVLSQREEPTVVIEEGRGTRAPEGEVWRARTLRADLDAVAISAASAGVVTLARGEDLDPLLAHVAAAVEPDAPWLLQPIPGGEVLRVDARSISLGGKEIPITANLRVLDYAVGPKGGAVAALGVAAGEGALLLLGGEEAPVLPGAVVADLVPDAYLPATGFELVRLVVNAAIAEATRDGRG